jgi:DNA helicase-2/ATP-dependent DNA helicase PcrA
MLNKFPGKCACGVWVEAEAGSVRKNSDTGRWDVRCETCNTGNAAVQSLIAHGTAILKANPGLSAKYGRPLPAKFVLLSGHDASDQQAAVFEHFAWGHGSVIVNAVAGAGKTSTMKNAIRYAPRNIFIQMFAFGSAAAQQLKAAIEELKTADDYDYSRVNAGTFHSVGLRAVRKFLNLPDAQVTISENKCRNLLKQTLGIADLRPGAQHPNIAIFSMYAAFVCDLVRFAKGEGLGALKPLDVADFWHLVEYHGMSLNSEHANVTTAVRMAIDLLALSNEAAKTGALDYADMLYLVCLWKLRLWQNDIVICDEAQDSSPVRIAMLHLSLKPGGKLYAVGDDFQAIMGFAGASNDAMSIIRREFNCKDLPLTVSYRCARKVVERAQTWNPIIQASPFAPEGDVLDDVALCDALDMLTAQDAILCRQTAPLVEVAYGLIAGGRACQILGREIGEGLVNLIEQQKAKGIERLVEKLEAWKTREMAKFIAKGEEQKAEAVDDKVSCINVLINGLSENDRTIPALIVKIRSLFTDQKEGVAPTVLTLCTQHRSKGLEWDNVAILRPDLNPSKAARQAHQLKQEFHLLYVANTRAKVRTINCAFGDMKIVKKAA